DSPPRRRRRRFRRERRCPGRSGVVQHKDLVLAVRQTARGAASWGPGPSPYSILTRTVLAAWGACGNTTVASSRPTPGRGPKSRRGFWPSCSDSAPGRAPLEKTGSGRRSLLSLVADDFAALCCARRRPRVHVVDGPGRRAMTVWASDIGTYGRGSPASLV